MTSITPSDQVLMLLRAHLERREKIGKKARAPKLETSRDTQPQPLERARALATEHDLSSKEKARLLVMSLLEEEFGTGVATDPRFLSLADDIINLINENNRAKSLLFSGLNTVF